MRIIFVAFANRIWYNMDTDTRIGCLIGTCKMIHKEAK